MRNKAMTKRQRYLDALHNKQTDELVWAPNFDYWLHINWNQKTIPPQFNGMGRNDIVRKIDAYIWCRANGLWPVYDSSLEFKTFSEGDQKITEIHTPIGSIRQVHTKAESEFATPVLTEHYIKDLESLKIMKYVAEATGYKSGYQSTTDALADVADDGVVLNSCFCVPFLQFAKTDAGYLTGIYMWMDHKEKVDELLNVYFKRFLEGYQILADGPCDVIATDDNMDGTMISPDIFEEYAIPFYQETKKITAGGNKLFEAHWCGRTQNLLHFVPQTGLDIVEAVVSTPMADIELNRVLEIVDGKVVLQGGIPAVYMCENISLDDFKAYIENTILPLKNQKGFILGMSDNVPPDADFSRVEMVSRLIK